MPVPIPCWESHPAVPDSQDSLKAKKSVHSLPRAQPGERAGTGVALPSSGISVLLVTCALSTSLDSFSFLPSLFTVFKTSPCVVFYFC